MMKKIGFLCVAKYPIPAVKGGAVETLVTDLLDENEKKHKLDMCVFSYGDKDAQMKSLSYVHTRFFYTQKTLWRKIANKLYVKLVESFGCHDSLYYHNIRRQIRMSGIDSLVLEASAGYAVRLKKDFPNLSLFYHVHNIPDEKMAVSGFANVIDGCFCISQFIKNETIANLHIPKDKVGVLYNTVDTSIFQPVMSLDAKCALRKRCGLTKEDKVIIFTGRLQPYKGIKQLLEAVIKISDERVKLLVVGNSFFSGSRLTPFIKELKFISQCCRDRIIFAGFVPHHLVCEYYQMADIAVLPSIWDEPFGLTCLEALACGLPVITTRSGALPEIVPPSCGILVERNDEIVHNLCDNIKSLLGNDQLRESMGVEARKRALAFSSEEYLENFYRLISK